MNKKLEKLYINDVIFNKIIDSIAYRENISKEVVLDDYMDEICIKTNEIKNEMIEKMQEKEKKELTEPITLKILK